MRAINLIFVLDPDTAKVKWWRVGLARRQHDPDWLADGTISIFDNNMHRGFSRILRVDPASLEVRTTLEGQDFWFYSWHRGKHQVHSGNHQLVTSAAQGRVFEVDETGNLVFDFLNLYSPERGALVVSEARFLPEGYFKKLPACES
jgi:hypothetical protein